MKRILFVLLIMMLAKIMCFSATTSKPIEQDSIVSVKVSDLKYANLIFVEHHKLLNENFLLQQQIDNYIELNNQLNKIDSLRLQQILEYDNLNQSYQSQIDALNREVKIKNSTIKFWQIGGITLSVGLLSLLLLK